MGAAMTGARSGAVASGRVRRVASIRRDRLIARDISDERRELAGQAVSSVARSESTLLHCHSLSQSPCQWQWQCSGSGGGSGSGSAVRRSLASLGHRHHHCCCQFISMELFFFYSRSTQCRDSRNVRSRSPTAAHGQHNTLRSCHSAPRDTARPLHSTP